MTTMANSTTTGGHWNHCRGWTTKDASCTSEPSREQYFPRSASVISSYTNPWCQHSHHPNGSTICIPPHLNNKLSPNSSQQECTSAISAAYAAETQHAAKLCSRQSPHSWATGSK